MKLKFHDITLSHPKPRESSGV